MEWLNEGLKHVGLAEIPGAKHNATIQAWLRKLGAWWSDDETPWCGVYVAHCMQVSGLPVPKYYMRAKAWADWGVGLSRPVVGCVVVFERKGGGHVGFVVGQDQRGNLMVLGGNQGNKVSVAPFDRSRVLAYRWPTAMPYPEDKPLRLVASDGKLSTNEA
ncbi:MAG TPA: TIGR02594 family protein [Limnobacter sp.]|nr:TIGR02594 family protein [Limnobacter sp.]